MEGFHEKTLSCLGNGAGCRVTRAGSAFFLHVESSHFVVEGLNQPSFPILGNTPRLALEESRNEGTEAVNFGVRLGGVGVLTCSGPTVIT